MNRKLDSFNLEAGRVLNGKYVVEECLGGGIEGEVYKVIEKKTGLHRAIKAFFPLEGDVEKTISRNARQMDRLRFCPLVIHYHTSETFRFRGRNVHYFVSEYVEGERLSNLCERYPGRRMPPFQALHVIYNISKGLETIHGHGEYHGDIHSDNVLIKQQGIFYEIKLIDFYYRGNAKRQEKVNDIYELVRLLYDITGGARRYAKQPEFIKQICRGLRKDLIRHRFPTVKDLSRYLESYNLDQPLL